MLLHDLVRTSADVAATRSRKKKLEHLASLLRVGAPDEVVLSVAWLSGELRQGKIGVGYAAAYKADPGGTAERPSLTVHDVDAAFDALQGIAGKGSVTRRQEALEALLARATPDEQTFLRKLVVGELRQGALEGLMVDALAQATGIEAAKVRRAAMLRGDLKEVARLAVTEGAPALDAIRLTLLSPVQPMLAQTATGVEDALERLDDAALEYKLDGVRLQVHRLGPDVRVFTRQLHDVTSRVPEVVEAALALPVEQAILDSEAIALRENGRPEPFQVTMRRFGRKNDVEKTRAEVPLSTVFFDCLHWDGRDLLDLPARERARVLEDGLPVGQRIPRVEPTSAEEAEAFFDRALADGHEGVMVKSLAAPYAAGRRGAEWLKVKPAHTLDLVVLAVDWGSGRRQGWLSNLHLGARDAESGAFVMLGKTFKGMSDEMLAWQTEKLQALEVSRTDWTVFVRPELVVEIAFDGVQESSQYPGGLALRFARVKGYRPDKSADEADTLQRIIEIFEASRA